MVAAVIVLPLSFRGSECDRGNPYPNICKGERYIMKATGIVRRVEEYGIIGQISKNRINTKDFSGFCKKPFTQNIILHSNIGVDCHSDVVLIEIL